MMHCEEYSIISMILVPIIMIIMRNITNPNWPILFNSVNVMKHKERLSNQIKGDSRDNTENTPARIFFAIKGHVGIINEISVRSVDYTIVSMLIS